MPSVWENNFPPGHEPELRTGEINGRSDNNLSGISLKLQVKAASQEYRRKWVFDCR